MGFLNPWWDFFHPILPHNVCIPKQGMILVLPVSELCVSGIMMYALFCNLLLPLEIVSVRSFCTNDEAVYVQYHHIANQVHQTGSICSLAQGYVGTSGFLYRAHCCYEHSCPCLLGPLSFLQLMEPAGLGAGVELLDRGL